MAERDESEQSLSCFFTQREVESRFQIGFKPRFRYYVQLS
ncbi:hypothetical protein VINE108274_08970 [Vibrio neptunius]